MRSRAPLARTRDGEAVDPSVLAATAALLVEVAYGDHDFVDAERRTIRKSLAHAFGISRADSQALLESVDPRSRHAGDLARSARVIVGSYDWAQRQQILGLVWAVVFADRIVDDAEERLAARLTALLSLTPEQSLEAREKAFQWFSTSRSET
ncbi:MAG: TerB family tellurite resistance protein [Myxococcota bacterium]